MSAPEPEEPPRRIAAVLAMGLALAVLAGVAAAAWWLERRGVDVTALRTEDVERAMGGWMRWAWIGSILLMVLHSFLPLPAEIIAVANGMLFGPWGGIAVTWVGAMLGAALAFAVARWLGRPVVRALLPARHWRRIDSLPIEAHALLVMRLIPVISFNLLNYAAGLLGVPWWRFLWTTAVGILPLGVAMVLFGGELMYAPWWGWLLASAAVVALWLLGHALRGWRE